MSGNSGKSIHPRKAWNAFFFLTFRAYRDDTSRVKHYSLYSRVNGFEFSGHEEKLTVLRTVENCDTVLSHCVACKDPAIIANACLPFAHCWCSPLTRKSIKILPYSGAKLLRKAGVLHGSYLYVYEFQFNQGNKEFYGLATVNESRVWNTNLCCLSFNLFRVALKCTLR